MDQHTVLIADSSEDFCLALQDILRWTCTVRTCTGGSRTLKLLSDLHPDVLVLDLMLPELDGISLLKALSAAGRRPLILATTCLTSDYIISTTQALGVDYLLVKPCDIHSTAARIQEQLESLDGASQDPSDLHFRITGLLMMMGFSPKLHGFRYLQEAIYQMIHIPGQSVTKELYPSVAGLFETAGCHVERSIRSAIADAWAHRDSRVWQLYFPLDTGGQPKRPTNAVFISRIADGLRVGTSRQNTLQFIPASALKEN